NITLIEFVANRVIQLLSFTFLTDIYMKKNPEIYISILSKLFSFYIILNFLSIIIFPNGLWLDHKFRPAYILGIGNSMAYMIIPGIIFISLNSWIKKRKISLFSIFMILISIITFF